MNIKKATNSQLSTIESKNKQTNKANKQNRNRIIDTEINGRIISWEGEGGNGEMVQGLRSIFGKNKIGRGKLRIA